MISLIEIEKSGEDSFSVPYAKVVEALNRYIKYNLQFLEDGVNILFVPLDSKECWQEFVKKLESNNAINCYNGFLFFTCEDLMRKGKVAPEYNKSRMVREFVERAFYAKTANLKNIFEKMLELYLDILKDDKETDKMSALNNLEEYKQIIKNLDGYKKFCKKDDEICKDYWKNMQELYMSRNFHTISSHKVERNCDEKLIKGKAEGVLCYRQNRCQEFLYDLAFTVSHHPKRLKGLRILVIDDNVSQAESDFKDLARFLGKDAEIFITGNGVWKRFLERQFWVNLYKGKEDKMQFIKIFFGSNNQINVEGKNNWDFFFSKNKQGKVVFNLTHIVVDLLLGEYNEGNRIIRELLRLRTHLERIGIKAKYDIIALSLSEEIEDIQRSINEGAIVFVPKKRIYSLPGIIARLEESGRDYLPEGSKHFIAKYRNFGKLYKLPERVKRKLQTEPFVHFWEGEEIKEEKIKALAEKLALQWIRKIPKAELHYHLGGSMDADLIYLLSLTSLMRLNERWDDDKFEAFVSKSAEIMKELLKDIVKNDKQPYSVFQKERESFIELIDDQNKSDEEQSEDDEKKQFLEWYLPLGREDEWIKILKNRSDEQVVFDYILWKLRKEKDMPEIKQDYVVLLFIAFIGTIEGRESKFILDELDELENMIGKIETDVKFNIIKTQYKLEIVEEAIKKIKNISNVNKVIEKIKNVNDLCPDHVSSSNTDILRSLISAENHEKNLKGYLRGSFFTGSLHLQYPENIFITVFHLIRKALQDNIRYLEIRLALEGYTKEGLTIQEAIQILFAATDMTSYYMFSKGKYIWVNYILSGKRHKTPEKLAIEVATAITYRKRNLKVNELRENLGPNMLTAFGYKWNPSMVVGFDLSGLEKGNRPSQFVQDFSPLFKTCANITIHAGEEDTAESIWEAVYLLHAQRIGHGLTLSAHPFLIRLVRDLQICVEMAPYSNTFTNPNLEKEYPLYDYIKEGLSVTINTDDMAYSDRTLSEEYVKAAELYWERAKSRHDTRPITKWDTLRLVKNGFKMAFIEREEKRNLLRAVEDEVYQLILKMESIEPDYEIDFL